MSEEQAVQVDPIEAKARGMGWVPREEFRRNLDRWVDAETFVKRGEDVLPIQRERLNKALDDLEGTRAEIRKMKQTFEEFGEYHRSAIKRQQAEYEAKITELRAQQRKFVAAGDVDSFDAAEKQIAAFAQAKEEVKAPESKQVPVMAPEAQEWIDKNPLIVANKRAFNYAIAAEAELIEAGYSGRDLYQKLTDDLASVFPSLVPSKKREKTVQTLEGTGDETKAPKKTNKKSLDNLPSEYRAAYEKYKNLGLIKDEAEYIAGLDSSVWEEKK